MNPEEPAGSDPTRMLDGADRPGLPVPGCPALWKLLIVAETLKRM